MFKKHIGRPRLPEGQGKRHNLGFKTTKELKALLKSSASSAQISITREIEKRLWNSFQGTKTREESPSWRCFFCNEVFISFKTASEHFGVDESCTADIPACKISAHEGHLITYIRKLEKELRRYQAEDTDIMRSIRTLESEIDQKLKAAEEAGYAKGISDMKTQGLCPEPVLHEI